MPCKISMLIWLFLFLNKLKQKNGCMYLFYHDYLIVQFKWNVNIFLIKSRKFIINFKICYMIVKLLIIFVNYNQELIIFNILFYVLKSSTSFYISHIWCPISLKINKNYCQFTSSACWNQTNNRRSA